MSSIKPSSRRMPSSAFTELMALKRVDENTQSSGAEFEKVEYFTSISPPYSPANADSAFGGHVYAQSAYAASKATKRGFVLHNISGFFLRPGQLDVPFIYSVRHVRDGATYCFRAVEAKQKGKTCFSCLCSFKRPESKSNYNHQPPHPELQRRYAHVLHGKRPEDHPIVPGIDSPWYISNIKSGRIPELEFPGVDVRKVEMDQCNQVDEVRKNPHEYRQLQFYRFKGSPGTKQSGAEKPRHEFKEEDEDYDNLFACAHLYASDKNSLFIIPRALGRADDWTAMASLSLTVIFHQHGDALRMIDVKTGERKWFLEEYWTSRSGENRALHETRLWTKEGTLLATALQDSMIKIKDVESPKL